VKKLVFVVLLLTGSFSDAVPASWGLLTLEVAVVLEQQSHWEESQISQMFSKTNKILSRCFIQVRPSQQFTHFVGQIPMGYESVPLANFFYEVLQKPVVFLVNSNQYNNSAGFAPGSRFLFLSSFSRTEEYQNKRNHQYEPLAHELGHMLGGLTHLDEAHGSNLMSGYSNSQNGNLTVEQCKKIRNHPYLIDEGLRF
jgi:hypothetical protein